MLTNKFWRSIVLLVLAVFVISISGCGASRGNGGGVFNQPLVMNVPISTTDEDRAILNKCVKQVNEKRVKEGKVPIETRDELTKAQKRARSTALDGASALGLLVAPLAIAGIVAGHGSVVDREKSTEEAKRDVGACVSDIRRKAASRYARN